MFDIRIFFLQAEDGIRDLVRSRGLGDVYKRQAHRAPAAAKAPGGASARESPALDEHGRLGREALHLSLIHI